MRDKIKDVHYFSLFIEKEKYTIQRLTDAIYSTEVNAARIPYLWDAILISHLDIIHAEYSRGANGAKIKELLINLIPIFENHFKYLAGYEDYDIMIWIVSLGILCDLELVDFMKITSVVRKYDVQDRLIDFLIQSKQPEWNLSGQNIIQKYPYEKALAIKDHHDIKTYLTSFWYKGHSDASWYNSHKNTQLNIYSGYWAWEASAIAKIKNIDDTAINDLKYYPYDAVHWDTNLKSPNKKSFVYKLLAKFKLFGG